ncbi:MAG: nucleotidyltransferase family protein [Proteobacteria bacterium]|nr:nucleotidyltransferase family protein [Pseudomonadota bacterium]
MNDQAGELDLERVHLALRKTTETLVRELGTPQPTPPDWSQLEWQVAKSACAIHGISGLLARGLHWRGPDHWQAFLCDQGRQIAGRWPRIQGLLRRLDDCAVQQGVPMVGLKGVALQGLDVYGTGERPMADVDLLVREEDVGRAADIILRMGYRESGTTWKHRSFEPATARARTVEIGEHTSADIKIELHTTLREALPLRTVDLTPLVFPAQARPGLNGYASQTALLLHVMVHTSGTMIFREGRALHLSDIARLCARMSPADWDGVMAIGATEGGAALWWAYPSLQLADRYFACIPPQVLELVARACPRRLHRWYRDRSLTDVSHSHLWVSAFPGLEWARSGREIATYVARRIRPSAETIAQRREFARSQPLVSGGEWSRTSQPRRILRWLLARQPRQATLQGVRASLNLPT